MSMKTAMLLGGIVLILMKMGTILPFNILTCGGQI